MALGYEGLVTIDSVPVRCTSGSVPQTRNRMDSSATFGGEFNSLYPSRTIGGPRLYDWDTNDGSVSVEITPDFFDTVEYWIRNRKESKSITLRTNYGASQNFAECFWNSIEFSAADGSLISGNIGFTSVERTSQVITSEYTTNRTGQNVNNYNYFINADYAPIPFWKSYIVSTDLIPTVVPQVELLSWTLTFAQNPQKYFFCSGENYTVVAPEIIGIGPMSISLQVELYVKSGPYSVPEDITSLYLYIDSDNYFVLNNLELQDKSDEMRTDPVTISLTYQVYGLTI